VHRARLFLRKRLEAYFSITGVDRMPGVAAICLAIRCGPMIAG